MKMSTDRNEWKQKIKAILYYKGIEKEEESGKVNYIRPVKHLSFSEEAGRWATGQQMESKVAVHQDRRRSACELVLLVLKGQPWTAAWDTLNLT